MPIQDGKPQPICACTEHLQDRNETLAHRTRVSVARHPWLARLMLPACSTRVRCEAAMADARGAS
jgi:hypothetical protein